MARRDKAYDMFPDDTDLDDEDYDPSFDAPSMKKKLKKKKKKKKKKMMMIKGKTSNPSSGDSDDEDYNPFSDALTMKRRRNRIKSYDHSSGDSDDEDRDPSSYGSTQNKKRKTSESSSAGGTTTWSDSSSDDRQPATSFEQPYRCFPLSHIQKEHLEDGNRIIMPASALDRLAFMEIQFPIVFEIKKPDSDRVSRCGVLEFSADEGLVFLPNWMMKSLNLQEGELVVLKNASLPKATYIKIQPHTTAFVNLPDPKQVLEAALKNFSCVSTGDTIMITHDYDNYYIDVLETRPSQGVSVVETDCEVDFAPPLDYIGPKKEPEKLIDSKVETRQDCEKLPGEKPKFQPFTGTGRRLDGTLVAAVSSLGNLAIDEQKSSSQKRVNGKLVFGHGDNNQKASRSSPLPEKPAEEKSSKSEEKKFQPFTGKKYTLAG